MGTEGAAGRKRWSHVPRGRETPRLSGSQRPEAGAVVSSKWGKQEVMKCPRTPHSSWPATPDDPAGRQKQDPQLSPGAGFLSAWEVSNVRSPPPCIPSGGQASHFPFRKGQSKRPGKAHQGEMEGVRPRLAPPAGLDPGLSAYLTAGGLLPHLPVCLFSFTSPFTHSFNRHFPLSALGQARCWGPGSQGAHGIWGQNGHQVIY